MSASTGNIPDPLRQEFLEEIRLSNAMNDALKTRGGGPVYKKVPKDKTPEAIEVRRKHLLRREEFRKDLRSRLQHCAESYRQGVTSGDHISNIRELAKDFSDRYQDILKGKLSFGVVAKGPHSYNVSHSTISRLTVRQLRPTVSPLCWFRFRLSPKHSPHRKQPRRAGPQP